MVKELNRWLLEVDFKYSKFLSPYVDDIIEDYKQTKLQEKELSLDIPLNIKPVNDFILPKLESLVKKYFFIDKEYESLGCHVYIQPPSTTKSFLHNHAHHPGNICGVFYLNIPNEGGEFRIYNPPFIDLHIKPKVDKLYLFPIWLYHAAMPHKDNITRISFNWIYGGMQRPVYKFKGYLW